MTEVQKMASFVFRASWDELSEAAREALRVRVLDSLACAIGALGGEPIRLIRQVTGEFGGNPLCTLIADGKTAPDRAAFYNGALVRYLDFNDSYLAPGETCHPSDNLAPVLAAAEFVNESGKTLLTALAVAYQVQCRLSDVAPVRARGFDHVTQGVLSAAAGASKALSLDAERTANALAIAGTAYNALRVTRTGTLSNWKGLAFPDGGRSAVHATFLARQGITGPPELFEGNKGWRETISGEWQIDWSEENLEKVTQTDLKKYNAEIHSQSAIEGLLELMDEHRLSADDLEEIRVEVFDVAYNIIGGGEEGDKTVVLTKEQADHSLQYMLAVAALDRQVLPDQYKPERILRNDVQSLLRKVVVVPSEEYSRRFPAQHACLIAVTTKSGQRWQKEKTEYEGFHTRPMSLDAVERKFRLLAGAYTTDRQQGELLDLVRHLEDAEVADLANLLSGIREPT